jgi:subtilase family serine protease
MQNPFKLRAWPVRAHFAGRTRWRHVQTTLGAFAAVLLAPCAVVAQSGKIVGLSPMIAKSTVVSVADPAKEISVVLSLPLSDSEGAAEFVQRVSNPTDPLYRHYLTPEEFASRYGANATDYAALKQWAQQNGLQISHESLSRTLLTLRGTVAQFQTLFNTQLNNYRSPDGEEFYSASVSPTIPGAIAGKGASVIGLTNSIQYASHAKIHKVFGENPATPRAATDTGTGSGPGGAYKALDLRLAYCIPSFEGAVPQTVAVFEQGGFSMSDVQEYLKENNLPNTTVTPVPVNGFNGELGDAGIQLEAVLDIDMLIGINPNLKSVLVYEDGQDPFPVALLDAMDTVAQQRLASVLSITYGADEIQQGTWRVIVLFLST